MLKVAILDDYQNISQEFVDLKKLDGKYNIEIFNNPFENEESAIENLKAFCLNRELKRYLLFGSL